MNDLSNEQRLLKDYIVSAFGAGKRLQISYLDAVSLFPMSVEKIADLSDQDEIRIDALLYRFGSTLSITQDHLFKAIARVEGEDINASSKRDIGNLMEKLGAIHRMDDFTSFAILRNKLFHAYPDDPAKQVQIVNDVFDSCAGLVNSLSRILEYISDKKLIPDIPEFKNMVNINSGNSVQNPFEEKDISNSIEIPEKNS